MKRLSLKGFTLPEMLVALTLTLILLYGVYAVLSITRQQLMLMQAQANSQQSAQVALKQITGDLMRSAADQVSTSANPVGLMFPDTRDANGQVNVDSAGKALYRKWVCYYLANDARGRPALWRKETWLNTPSHTPTAPYGSVSNFVADSGVPARIVANDVANLATVTSPTTATVTVASQTDYGSRPNLIQVSQTLVFRNPH